MTVHRLRLLLTLAAISLPAGSVLAQGGLSAPSPAQRDACIKAYGSLREDAETKGNMIKTAGAQHVPPEETCKIVGSYRSAVEKMIKYVQANAIECGIPPSVTEQLKATFIGTESLQRSATPRNRPESAGRPARSTISAILPSGDSVFNLKV